MYIITIIIIIIIMCIYIYIEESIHGQNHK